jgi:hypothetical protein
MGPRSQMRSHQIRTQKQHFKHGSSVGSDHWTCGCMLGGTCVFTTQMMTSTPLSGVEPTTIRIIINCLNRERWLQLSFFCCVYSSHRWGVCLQLICQLTSGRANCCKGPWRDLSSNHTWTWWQEHCQALGHWPNSATIWKYWNESLEYLGDTTWV